MNKQKHWIFLLVLAFFTSSASNSSAKKPYKHSESIPNVYVVNYPLKYFTERIAGDYVRVVLPAPINVDPASWMPDVTTILEYQTADIILRNGAGYAKWISKVSLPKSNVFNTSYNFFKQYIKHKSAVTHKHGPVGEHEHTATASTTWLNPLLAIKHAQAIESNLRDLLPDKKETFRKNYKALEQDLLAIDQSIQQTVATNKTLPLIVSHPVYDYFIQRYGLNVQSVHWEPDEMPDEKMWRDLEILLTRHPAKWMIWESEPLKEIQEKLRILGVRSIVFNPCGNTPKGGDYLSVMRQNVEHLKKVFQSTET
jgi:zinc transport system substrate-binding protein